MQLIIFDFNRTIYNPETNSLVSGALEVLQHFSAKGIPMVLVSRDEGDRENILMRLGVSSFFEKTFFVREKSKELFLSLMHEYGTEPETTLVVGDYPASEILHGNAAGARTVRLKAGRFADYEPRTKEEEPWRTIYELHELLDLG